MASMFDIMGSIFKGLMNPDQLASEMAQNNISPEELMAQVKQQQQMQMTPTAGAQSPQGSGLGGILGDLFAPMPKTAQQGQAGDAIRNSIGQPPTQAGRNSDLSGLDNTMMDFFRMLATGSNASEQQAQGSPNARGGLNGIPQGMPQPMSNSVGQLMNPNQGSLGGPQTAQVLQPMPQQLQGMPAQHMSLPPQPNQAAMQAAPKMPMPADAMQAPNSSPLPEGNPLGGIMPPQARSTMTTPVPTIPNSRAGELETRGMPGNIRAAISEAAQKYGQDPNTLMRIAGIESSGNPNAKNPSGATGLFQFMPGTAKEYGLTNPLDPIASADAAARLLRDNRETLTAKLGREPSPGELYLAHQQGSGGASKLLSNPDAKAIDMVGAKAVTGNGGSANMTSQQFADLWINKMNNYGDPPLNSNPAKPSDPSAPTPTARPTDNPSSQFPAAPTTGAKDYTKGPFSLLDALDTSKDGSGQEPDLNLPKPPAPVAPQPGRYDVNPQVMQLMMALLGPGAGGANIPSIAQLMGQR